MKIYFQMYGDKLEYDIDSIGILNPVHQRSKVREDMVFLKDLRDQNSYMMKMPEIHESASEGRSLGIKTKFVMSPQRHCYATVYPILSHNLTLHASTASNPFRGSNR